jgi:hypothetical protein
MDKIYTSLARIRSFSPCGVERGSKTGYRKLLNTLGKDYGEETPVTFRQIYESNGYEDTLWCFQTIDKKYYPIIRHFAVDCAERVKPLMSDPRSIEALEVARRFADGEATAEELKEAWAAAWAAARDAAAYVAWDAADAVAVDEVAWAAEKQWQMKRWFEYCRLGRRPN